MPALPPTHQHTSVYAFWRKLQMQRDGELLKHFFRLLSLRLLMYHSISFGDVRRVKGVLESISMEGCRIFSFFARKGVVFHPALYSLITTSSSRGTISSCNS